MGTLNLLELCRNSSSPPIFVYASTNKVYGKLEGLGIEEQDTRYVIKEQPDGITEKQKLDFYSPYGCSKGVADQYTRDYSRIFGLKTVVFRQSCIYGPRQFGVEDQGWAAHFAIASLQGKQIKIYGNGKQVRDMLHVDDLVRAYLLAVDNIDTAAGKIYNIGGGPNNTMSIWSEFRWELEKFFGSETNVSFRSLRPGDQLVYVSNILKAKKDLGWKPEIEIKDGIHNLFEWVSENKYVFK